MTTLLETHTAVPLPLDNMAGLQKHTRNQAAARHLPAYGLLDHLLQDDETPVRIAKIIAPLVFPLPFSRLSIGPAVTLGTYSQPGSAAHHDDSLCGFNLPNGIIRTGPPFSLHKTASNQGQTSGQLWNCEGEQNLHQDPISSYGNTQNGFFDSMHLFRGSQDTNSDHNHGRGSFSGSSIGPWSAELSSTEMSRDHSMDSIGARSQGTTYSSAVNSYDQSRSAGMFPRDSQMPYTVSSTRSNSSDGPDSPVNPALNTPTMQEISDFEHYSYQTGEDLSGDHQMFPMNPITGTTTSANIPLTSGASFNVFAPSDEIFFPVTTDSNSLSIDSASYSSSAMIDPSAIWSSADFPDSERSSPTLFENPWPVPPQQIITSTTSSPLEYPPSLGGLSPARYVQDFTDIVEQAPYGTTGDRTRRRSIGPRKSKVASDLAAHSRHPRLPGSSDTSEESFKLGGRSSVDHDNTARDDPLYHNVTPKADGLYHCPFENDPKANCTHKPEKLKCNYDKFVDSHLKPYKCKASTCKDLCFSSTACLLRHEREAHAMHGHGDKPFLCTYDNCERGVQGNGFPRHWNLRDHMKRVHNDPGQPKSNTSGSPPASGTTAKGKKRKADDNPDAPYGEKSLKKNTTPPALTHQPQEPSLVDRYQEKQKKLVETVAKLQDPKNSKNFLLLQNAMDSLKVMAQTTQRINAAPAVGENFSQQSG